MSGTRRLPLIGILALQGDVAEHSGMVRRLGVSVRCVKLAVDLHGLDGLIIPGGESTTIGKLLRRFKMLAPLRDSVRGGLPVFGTCAGMILVSNEIHEAASDQPVIGGMDIAIERNAFGSQVESFETDVFVSGLQGGQFHAVFIRAPIIRGIGPGVDVLARLPDNTPVAARQNNMLVTSFHPELTRDVRMHGLFLSMVKNIQEHDGGEMSFSSDAVPARASNHPASWTTRDELSRRYTFDYEAS